jgi:hypothetical protein
MCKYAGYQLFTNNLNSNVLGQMKSRIFAKTIQNH